MLMKMEILKGDNDYQQIRGLFCWQYASSNVVQMKFSGLDGFF